MDNLSVGIFSDNISHVVHPCIWTFPSLWCELQEVEYLTLQCLMHYGIIIVQPLLVFFNYWWSPFSYSGTNWQCFSHPSLCSHLTISLFLAGLHLFDPLLGLGCVQVGLDLAKCQNVSRVVYLYVKIIFHWDPTSKSYKLFFILIDWSIDRFIVFLFNQSFIHWVEYSFCGLDKRWFWENAMLALGKKKERFWRWVWKPFALNKMKV